MAKQAFSQISDAQIQDMDDEFWNDLLFKIDEEVERLESMAKPDQAEFDILNRIDREPRNLAIQYELARHLRERNRRENCIPVLLNILAVERNYDDKRAYQMLMELFAELGSANEAVKKGRR